MSTADTSLGVINSMTETYLESLKDSSGKVASLANQLIMTNDVDDINSVNCIKSELLYDKNSTDSSINRGYQSGIASSTEWTMDITGYKYLKIYYQMYFGAAYNTGGNCNILELGVDSTKTWNIAHGNPFYYDNGSIVSTQFAIDYRYNTSTKKNVVYFFNNGGEATSGSAYHIFRIEGVKGVDVGVFSSNGVSPYPIGAVYMSTDSTSPANLFGGIWTQIKDKFLLSAGDTYTAGVTGGESTHTLTVNEMPSHSHLGWVGSDVAGNANAARMGYNNYEYRQVMTSAGGDQPHNNMPPYLVVYVWKRIA